MHTTRQTAAVLAAAWLLGATAAWPQAQWAVTVSVGRSSVDDGPPFFPGRLPSISLAGNRRLARGVAAGLELGFHRSVNDSFHMDATPFDPEQTIAGRASAWRVTPTVRLQTHGRTIRPYLLAGAGLYWLRNSSRQEARDAGGALILSLRHSESRLRPGSILGSGLDWFPLRGRLGLALAGRAHFPSEDDAFVSLEVGVALRE